MLCMLKKEKNTVLIFQKITQIVKNREVRSEGLWHYLAVHKLSALLTGITSKYQGNFCCLNCIHSFATEKKTKKV